MAVALSRAQIAARAAHFVGSLTACVMLFGGFVILLLAVMA